MAETRYQDLSADDRRDALQVAERGSNHKAHLLEKDITLMEQCAVIEARANTVGSRSR